MNRFDCGCFRRVDWADIVTWLLIMGAWFGLTWIATQIWHTHFLITAIFIQTSFQLFRQVRES